MHPMDMTLQASFPTIMVPKFGSLTPLSGSGERLLVGTNGVFLEVVRPWLRVVRKIASYEVETAVPYGTVNEETELPCGQLPAELVGQFGEMARASMPNETEIGRAHV